MPLGEDSHRLPAYSGSGVHRPCTWIAATSIARTGLSEGSSVLVVTIALSMPFTAWGGQRAPDTMGFACSRRRFLKSSAGIAPCS